jgi:hypothetical protein
VTSPYPILRSDERPVQFSFDLASPQRVRPVQTVDREITTGRILPTAIILARLLVITLTSQGSIDMSGATTPHDQF